MDGIEDSHLDQHLSVPAPAHPTTSASATSADAPPAAQSSSDNSTGSGPAPTATTRRPLRATRQSVASSATIAGPAQDRAPPLRRSARISISGAAESAESKPLGQQGEATSSDTETGSKRKRSIAGPSKSRNIATDRKGKKKASPASSPLTDVDQVETVDEAPLAKRTRRSTRVKADDGAASSSSISASASTTSKGKGKAKAVAKKPSRMPKKTTTPKNKRGGQGSSNAQRSQKGDHTPKHLDEMEDDEAIWGTEAGPSRSGGRDHDMDDDMEDSDHEEHSEDDDEHENEPAAGRGGTGRMSAFDRFQQLAAGSGMHLDEATASAIFGRDFGALGGLGGILMGSGGQFKRLRTELRSASISTRLAALRECSEILLVSNEDTLGSSFSVPQLATEFIAILKGKPNIDEAAAIEAVADDEDDEMDEDAQLARALAMSTDGTGVLMENNEEEMECQLVACRCLAHLIEALPGTGHTLVHLGAVPVLCSKLNEPSYIELAEQTLSTMEKISAEYPSSIVREGGLEALLKFLDFFSTNVQRTAVTAAANCCKNISSEHYAQVKDVFPTLRNVLTQTDQRLVEQATLAVVRVLEAYRNNAEHLEGLLNLESVVAINALLVPSGGSPLISAGTYTHLLRALTTAARGSAKVTIAFLEAGMTSTVYQILTGVLPPAHDEDEQGMSPGGQGLAGGVADMAVLQNLAHRPKDQVEEALALICELLPPTTKEGVFESRAYSEKALHKLLKGRSSKSAAGDRPEAQQRRSARKVATTDPQTSTGASTPTGGAPETSSREAAAGANPAAVATATASSSSSAPSAAIQAAIKQKKEAEALAEKRLELLSVQYKLFERFIRAIVPVLVDVYAASVAARVRTKVLTGLVRAMAFAKPDEMRMTLKSVPMASFLGAIISSKDNHSYVLSALQLIELLSVRLPDIYKPNFLREGVVFEIEALAKEELTTAKAARLKEEAEAAALVKTEPEETPMDSQPETAGTAAVLPVAGPSRIPAMPGALPGMYTSSLLEDLKPLIGHDGVPTSLARFLSDPSAASPGTTQIGGKKYAYLDPLDANILRARVMLAKKLFELDGDDTNAATAVLGRLADLVKVLIKSTSSDGELRDALKDIAAQFTDSEHSLSSFELLQSGLIDGLLEFADVEGVVVSVERRAMLFDTFSAALRPASSPLAMLVKRLHESLGRLETFEVETAFNGVADSSRSSSSLGRTMRIRMQPEDNEASASTSAAAAAARQALSVSVTIQAVATVHALNEYLRPRVGADGQLTQSTMSQMYGYGGMAIPRGGGSLGGLGGGSNARSLLEALTAAGGMSASDAFGFGSSAPEPRSAMLAAAAAARPGASAGPRSMFGSSVGAVAGGSSGAGTGTASAPSGEKKVQRRRSARLSAATGAGADAEAEAEAAEDAALPTSSAPVSASAPAGPSSSAPQLSSSAPESSGIFGTMPMDMDFDDDYSDEEYDAEMFDDEMEEELTRPQERIVNMSVAPDGSKVEVKTPDGTRVATPSQAATAANAAAAGAGAGTGAAPPAASGSGTPRTASYAGALKASPSDWHLAFTLNGKPVSFEDTIYGAVHKTQSKSASTLTSGVLGGYGSTVIFKFRRVEGPAPSAASADAPTPAMSASGVPEGFDPSLPTTKILRLLRLVHELSVEAWDAGVHGMDQSLQEAMFVNNKLTAKLTRQLEETMIIASNCLPLWATELPKHFPFLFPFEARYSYLQSNSFGYSRLIARYQAAQQARGGSSANRRDDLAHLARIVRQKVRISRGQLLESAAKVLELYGTGSAILEVEYFDEIGTGLGPTLEFYSLASREFARRSLGVWRDEDSTKEGAYVHAPRGLFPVPLRDEEVLAGPVIGSKLGWYKTLGLFVGRALLDTRIIDVNLNKVLLKLVLGAPVKRNIATLKMVDAGLARSLDRLQVYSATRREIEALSLPAETKRQKLLALSVGGAMLADLSLDFTLPGYDIELKPGGASIDVDDSNIDEYLELVLDKTLGSGISHQVKALQDGFSMIFPVRDMRLFSPDELALLFGNAEEDWSKETIEHAIKADHGYNLDSRSVRSLIDVMAGYSKEERRQFLQFITGAPKLPIGGFRGLNPQFTVVRKPHEAPFRADDYLPSVMTCAQYLKLPDYSSRDVLQAQLQRAMLDGGGSFHLS